METPTISSVDSFFREQSQFGRYRLPVLIVTLAGLAMGLRSIAVYYGLGSDGSVLSNAVTVSFVLDFGEPIALWLLFTAAFYVLSKLFGARTRFGRMFKLAGWGFAPFVVFGALRAVGTYFAVQGATVPESVQAGVIGSEQEGFRTIVSQASGDPALVAATVVGCLFLLSSGYIWVQAVDNSTTLERNQEWIVVGVPLVAYVVYVLMQVF